MSSIYGQTLKLSVFGQSHGPAIGMTLDGIPAGLPIHTETLHRFLSRRAPGNTPYSTSRKEADIPEFLSGIVKGHTCGAPITAVILNRDSRREDYLETMDTPRPGHADYTAHIKYGGYEDHAGGGHFSGRLTASLCIAGGLCIQWLEDMGIHIAAHISSIKGIQDKMLDRISPNLNSISTDFPVIGKEQGIQMRQAIEHAKENGDSVGGTVTCAITGIPAGVGEPIFDGVESKLAQILYSIPAMKALEFGAGNQLSQMKGSESNDPFTISNGQIVTITNHSGGIIGGITNGMPVIFKCTFKPTPSISLTQHTVSLKEMTPRNLQIHGRHDPCIVPRAVPVVEAAAAIAIYDLILSNSQLKERT